MAARAVKRMREIERKSFAKQLAGRSDERGDAMFSLLRFNNIYNQTGVASRIGLGGREGGWSVGLARVSR